MTEFQFQPMFPLPADADDASYRRLTGEHVRADTFDGRPIIRVDDHGLEMLADAAFTAVAFLYRSAHFKQLATILHDP